MGSGSARTAPRPNKSCCLQPKRSRFRTGPALNLARVSGIPALTAAHAIAASALEPGQTVLIAGGAGSVSNFAIQIAKAKGARVLATVSSPAKAAKAKASGADETIDYKTQNIVDAVESMTGKKGVDALVEVNFVANAQHIPRLVAEKGVAIVYGSGGGQAQMPAAQFTARSITLKFFRVYELTAAARSQAIGTITDMIAKGRLEPSISALFPLDDIASAHDKIERGDTIGSVLLTI